MMLNRDQLYEALLSRDTRLDGQFFTGVTTTGIYCRSVCPAPKPKKQNVEFYPSAAAASAAGFRPCLRCQPELAPQYYHDDPQLREALRLIATGYLDGHDVPDLASQLGCSERQLRRHFAEQLGASPMHIAQTRRLLQARQLLLNTTLPLGVIADCCGYPTRRQFNLAFQQALQMTPSDYRQRHAKQSLSSADSISLTLLYRPPLDWDTLLGFLSFRAIDGVEMVDVAKRHYARALVVNGLSGWVSVQADEAKHQCHLQVSAGLLPELTQVLQLAKQAFDLSANPVTIDAVLAEHTLLRDCVARHPGLRVPGAWDRFELCVRAIAGQLVSVKSATTIGRKVATQYGAQAADNPYGLTHVFPTAEQLAVAAMPDVGLTKVRSFAVHGLAQAIQAGRVQLEALYTETDVMQALTALPGIGPWTAEYIAMRAFKLPDAFPAGDLILRRAVVDGEQLTETQCRKQTAHLAPWRAYAALHLWTHYSEQH